MSKGRNWTGVVVGCAAVLYLVGWSGRMTWGQQAVQTEAKKEAAPASESKAPEQAKPVETPKRDETKPPAESKPTETPKPAEAAKPSEPEKPARPAKPEVEISNIRFVTSDYGPVVTTPVFQPGEKIIVRYDINKFQTDIEGKSNLAVQHVLKSAADASELGTKEFDIRTICTQGPPIIWAARATLPPGTPPGKYFFEIRVHDNLIARKGSAKADFEIGPPKLAAVNPRFTADREGKTDIAPVFALGQRAYLQFSVVGLKVDQNNVRCGISAEAQGPDGLYRKIYKAQIPPTPAEGGNAPAVPVTVLLNNSHPGKTQVNVEIHDLNANATVNLSVSYEVLKSN